MPEQYTRKEWGVIWDFDTDKSEPRHPCRDEESARRIVAGHPLAEQGYVGTIVFRYVTHWIELKTKEDTDE